jgi:tetratricopeptide (TPR) repeat protein
MKIGHLLFPVLFFLILISGAYWIMRTVEEVSSASANPTVYLETSDNSLEVTAESVGSTREKAHQAFVRFADPLVENDVLSNEEKEHLYQILELGEGHWGKENWAPAFYAFERVLNELGPLIDEGLGYEKATEMEARYSQISQSLTTEIVLVESTYLEAIETANNGYNALLNKDWISAIQSFAKATDILNLVKAQAAEIVEAKLRDAYVELESDNFEASSELFNEVLRLIKSEEESSQTVLEAELVENVPEKNQATPAMVAPPSLEEIRSSWNDIDNPIIAEADRHFERRELKESLALYLDVRAKEPSLPGLNVRITQTRKAIREEELIRLMDKAKILAELGQWTSVIKTYRHILNVDPVHPEARRGWEDALVSLVAERQMDQYKDLIRHHMNANQYEHAAEVLTEAKNVLHDRDDFEDEFLTITSELKSQQVPVEITLTSDGETWVCIPGKMQPEQFTRKTITIFPGKFEMVGWKKGYEHSSVAVAINASDSPDPFSVICEKKITYTNYANLKGLDRIKTALAAFDVGDLLTDVYSFSAWVRKDEKVDGPLGSDTQIQDWDRGFFAKLYSALSQQEEKAFELTQLDARAHFLKVPDRLTRKETIELGQYLVSLD